MPAGVATLAVSSASDYYPIIRIYRWLNPL
jgi:hypothetical protein